MRLPIVLSSLVILAALTLAPAPAAADVRDQPVVSCQSCYAPNCAYIRHSEPLPELGARVQTSLVDAGIAGATAKAQAAGERCTDVPTGQGEFWVMTSVVSVEVPVADLDDLDAVGDVAAVVSGAVLTAISAAPTDEVPGGSPPQVGFVFVGPDRRVSLWTDAPKLQAAHDQGLTGAALLTALGYRV